MKENITSTKHSDTQVMENSSPVKILIVDNDGHFGKSLVELLHANGYFAYLADSSSDARKAILENHFDIIISDANMPDATCTELIIYSKKQQPMLEVIVTSRKPEFPEALQATRTGAFDYIGKNRLFNVILEKIKLAHHYQLNNLVRNISSHVEEKLFDRLRNSFPDYEIIREIGKGATGIVILARRQEKYYALKLLRRELHDSQSGKEQINRFLVEAEVMSQIEHPNVVRIFESGFSSDGQMPYILMEYIDGGTLKDYISRNAFSFTRKIKIILQLCDALDIVHKCGILHRDIKPANVMMQKSLSAKLSDFGIARTIGSNKNMALEIIGSPPYMAPEAFLGSHHVDPRSDIFSLGVVAYELLTGQKPFTGSRVADIVRYQKNQKSKFTAKQFINLPGAVQDLLVKMLKLNPDDRFQSMAEIIPALEAILHKESEKTIHRRWI
ncbi:MAG: serine/threonine-protein kinase [Victivallaceae bacterium]